jgi:hypothetical protein
MTQTHPRTTPTTHTRPALLVPVDIAAADAASISRGCTTGSSGSWRSTTPPNAAPPSRTWP